jgi:hypothetical protein
MNFVIGEPAGARIATPGDLPSADTEMKPHRHSIFAEEVVILLTRR